MKKQLDANAMVNELRGNSAFFPGYKEVPAAEPAPDKTPVPPAHVTPKPAPQPVPPVRVAPPVPPVRDVPPVKRVMKQRWPVDIYQDQYESLQQFALEERKKGGIGSMSAMVREALDRIIAEKKRGKK
jgi:hypothetical protein